MTEQTTEESVLLATLAFCLLLAGTAVAAVLYLAITLAAQYAGSFPGKFS